MQTKEFRFCEAINEGLDYSLKKDKKFNLLRARGNRSKRIYGTTSNLKRKIRKQKRVFDVPNSENANTGIIRLVPL